jgi:hypothetical protein
VIRGILRLLGIGGAATVAAVPMQQKPVQGLDRFSKVEAPKATQSDVGRFFDSGRAPAGLETKMMPNTAMREAWERAEKPGVNKREKRRHHKQRVAQRQRHR